MFRPLGNNILLRITAQPGKTAGGLFIPDNAKEQPVKGTVIALGNGVVSDIKPGDEVLYTKYSGTEIVLDAVPHLIVGEDQLVGVVV
jgi:chaperonin GroES